VHLYFTGKKENASLDRYVLAKPISGGRLVLNLQKFTTRLPPLSKTSAALIRTAATSDVGWCLHGQVSLL
jgi:hypothetical protein